MLFRSAATTAANRRAFVLALRSSLQLYNATVAKMQALCGERGNLAAHEALWIEHQIAEPLAQGVAIDAEDLRGLELVTAGFA